MLCGGCPARDVRRLLPGVMPRRGLHAAARNTRRVSPSRATRSTWRSTPPWRTTSRRCGCRAAARAVRCRRLTRETRSESADGLTTARLSSAPTTRPRGRSCCSSSSCGVFFVRRCHMTPVMSRGPRASQARSEKEELEAELDQILPWCVVAAARPAGARARWISHRPFASEGGAVARPRPSRAQALGGAPRCAFSRPAVSRPHPPHARPLLVRAVRGVGWGSRVRRALAPGICPLASVTAARVRCRPHRRPSATTSPPMWRRRSRPSEVTSRRARSPRRPDRLSSCGAAGAGGRSRGCCPGRTRLVWGAVSMVRRKEARRRTEASQYMGTRAARDDDGREGSKSTLLGLASCVAAPLWCAVPPCSSVNR